MDGLINLYKPKWLSSAAALERVRQLTGQRKSGHAGTLDPLADGVLIICLGRATKIVELLMDQPKVYRATATLDAISDTFDCETRLRPVTVPSPPTETLIRATLTEFEGTYEQVPPASSAVKVRGQPAYRLSRAGQTPALKPRPVRIYWLRVCHYAWPELEFEVACGRGTYVRALVRDISTRLGTGGCLTALSRRAVGPFRIEESWPLERLAAVDAQQALIEVERARTLLTGSAADPPPQP